MVCVTVLQLIRFFRHGGLKRYFETGGVRGLSGDIVKRIRVRLNVLDRARTLKDVDLPGLSFHALKGGRKGEYAIAVTGNFRLTFRMQYGDVLDLNLEDYH